MRKLTVALMLASVWLTAHAVGGSREAQWERVQDAIDKGLPRTAIQELEPIVEAALADRAWAEAVKAIARKIALEGAVEGKEPEERIPRLEAALTSAPEQIAPLLDTLLAHWYWQYFQRNRWRFMSRTATAEPPGDDFTTWDLRRLFARIDSVFAKALSANERLKRTPIGRFDDLLPAGGLPDRYRPTLYDFIAHEALTFYTSGEQAAAEPQDVFEISAESPILGSASEFLAWAPETTDVASPKLKAIRLYQRLMRFHLNDTDRSAFLDANIGRLVWAKNVAYGEKRDERFAAAMGRIAAEFGDHPLAATALYHQARVATAADDRAKARELALHGRTTHPESAGGKLCANLVTEIEAKSANVTVERVWNKPWPKARIRYRNVTKIHFRLTRWDWDSFLAKEHHRPDRLNEAERAQVLRKRPDYEWSRELPPTLDYRESAREVSAPDDLRPGFYFLIASHLPDFSDELNQLSMTDIWVSDLAVVLRSSPGEVGGFVLWADSGEPVAGARVRAWHLRRDGRRIAAPVSRTDVHGRFSFKSTERSGFLIKATYRGAELASSSEYAPQRPRAEERPFERTVFFTDRALYRPGQTVHYKGICLHADRDEGTYETLAGRRVTVTFYDANRKEIASREHRCNDYGSFSGNFTAPRDRVAGRMRIQVTDGPGGNVRFNVEEYKRPRFQVGLDAPDAAARLGDDVRLTGQATSYTGAALDDALVRYRVVREVRMPWWWRGHGGWPTGGDREIAHGALRTKTDGGFALEFPASPDPLIPEENEPSFLFRVHVDVTDSTGETRSSERTVRLGYTALEARVSANDWQTDEQPVEVRVKTVSLDGQPRVAEGSLTVYSLQEPESVHRASLAGIPKADPSDEARVDWSDFTQWPVREKVREHGFTTGEDGAASIAVQLPAGAYRIAVATRDRYGKPVTGRLPLRVLKPGADRLELKVANLLTAPRWSAEPGEDFMALWGTGYPSGRAFIEVEHQGEIIREYWTPPDVTQARIRLAVTEALRGGFTLHVTQVRENRAYLHSKPVEVPWSNKELSVKWEHFTSKLEPNHQETWTAVIQGPGARKRTAEMVAALYDASLDAFASHRWPDSFNVFRGNRVTTRRSFLNQARGLRVLATWSVSYLEIDASYRAFPPDLVAQVWATPRGRAFFGGITPVPAASPIMVMDSADSGVNAPADWEYLGGGIGGGAVAKGRTMAASLSDEPGAYATEEEGPNLSEVSARANLDETAFFFPHLLSDEEGRVRMTFTMPEALTEWRFLGFAHDRELRAGLLEGTTVTAKDLMVQPNPPRFLREGDLIEFTVKVLNQSDEAQSGAVRLTFADGLTEEPADALLKNHVTDRSFDIPAMQSETFAWRILAPDGLSALTYKAVAATEDLSDGETAFIPVLSRRILITESLPLPIRGPATEQFEFTRLEESSQSDTLRHQSLTVQMVSNPAWYAILALPYLMEFPHECTEQIFNRYYANTLARFIANSNPRIRRVFDQWKATPALDSPLEKNEDLKSVLLEETPWLRQAESESQARRNVGVLFDDNRLAHEMDRALEKLREQQYSDGAWPWFPGGRRNDYISLYITTGFGRLRHLGVDVPVDLALGSIERLDTWISDLHAEIVKRQAAKENHLTSRIALYLYGRSFFLKDEPIGASTREAVDYFLAQARSHWLDLDARQSQGHLALALHRFGDGASAKAIVRSLKERSVTDDESGRYWRDTEGSWYWRRAPIETQALMIEVFAEIAQDEEAVEECKTWILKQKQTQDWKTTKATADAVYALLLRGADLLSSTKPVQVSLGDLAVRPERVEAGTGFYEQRFVGAEVRPSMARITVRKEDAGVAWGAVHWQYLEAMSAVTPHADTPLELRKRLFVKRNTPSGPVLDPVTGPIAVGDELVVRIELRVDRDMEYVHLKDQRGSGTEPVNVLSGYQYQDGLGYYRVTRDAASHFFIDYLPKGAYVFEYSTRVQLRGEYETGVAAIQCMYAPEFTSHSESLALVVR